MTIFLYHDYITITATTGASTVDGAEVPGVMQFESNRFSVGKVSPLEIACFSLSSASRADLSNQHTQ